MEPNEDPRAFVAISGLTALVKQLVQQGVLDHEAYLAELRTAVVACEMRSQQDNAHAVRVFIEHLGG